MPRRRNSTRKLGSTSAPRRRSLRIAARKSSPYDGEVLPLIPLAAMAAKKMVAGKAIGMVKKQAKNQLKKQAKKQLKKKAKKGLLSKIFGGYYDSHLMTFDEILAAGQECNDKLQKAVELEIELDNSIKHNYALIHDLNAQIEGLRDQLRSMRARKSARYFGHEYVEMSSDARAANLVMRCLDARERLEEDNENALEELAEQREKIGTLFAIKTQLDNKFRAMTKIGVGRVVRGEWNHEEHGYDTDDIETEDEEPEDEEPEDEETEDEDEE
jgi:hypothetical protein